MSAVQYHEGYVLGGCDKRYRICNGLDKPRHTNNSIIKMPARHSLPHSYCLPTHHNLSFHLPMRNESARRRDALVNYSRTKSVLLLCAFGKVSIRPPIVHVAGIAETRSFDKVIRKVQFRSNRCNNLKLLSVCFYLNLVKAEPVVRSINSEMAFVEFLEMYIIIIISSGRPNYSTFRNSLASSLNTTTNALEPPSFTDLP